MPFGLRARNNNNNNNNNNSSSNNNNNNNNSNNRHQAQTRTAKKAIRVTIPNDAVPGETFWSQVGGRSMRVSCPQNAIPGDSFYIIAPKSLSNETVLSGVLQTDDPHVYFIAVPDNVGQGERFPVAVEGRVLQVERPPGVDPGTIMKITVPPRRTQPRQHTSPSSQERSQDANIVEVVVPETAIPGQKFTTLLQQGVQIQVVCPDDAVAGTTIRVNIGPQMLEYGDGLVRTLRITDMKFRWGQKDENGRVEEIINKDIVRSAAFVRKLELLPALQYLDMPDGHLSLVPANEVTVTSLISDDNNEVPSHQETWPLEGPPKKFLLTWKETTKVQKRNFHEKAWWFRDTCNRKFRVPWNEGHVSLDVRRGSYLLGDSVDIVMSLSPEDMQKSWRVTFSGEDGIDGGGLMRDWFQMVTEAIFDPNKGLWQPSASNQMCMEINPASGSFCENHLFYFRFMGRILGRAIFDNQLVSGHMVQYLFKHILGWPVTFGDLKVVDEVYHNSLMQLDDMAKEGTDVSVLCQDFTTTQDIFGSKQTVELVEGGENIAVTNENVLDYLEACLKHRLLDGVKPQLNELLLGFYDVIPEPMMAVFDFQELELLMCGLPQIDMDDWMLNTKYTGEFKGIGVFHPTCEWFWEILREEFDQEMKARTLQFVTATAGVPAHGFSALQSNEGAIRRFTIHGVAAGVYLYPRAHTCFNQIDLPIYNTKEELRERLTEAVVTGSGSFTLS